MALFSGLDIPPGDEGRCVERLLRSACRLRTLFSVGAHAHYIATTMKMTATLPSGEVLTLLSIKDWDFAWQDRYFFDHFITLPKGTRIDSEVHWNNSTDNPRNPSNPPIRVAVGQSSRRMRWVAVFLQKAVPHDEAELAKRCFCNDYGKHQSDTMGAAQKAMMTDPTFIPRMREKLQE